MSIAKQGDAAALAHTLKIRQQGQTNYFNFCQQAAGLGVLAASVLGAVLESKGVSVVGQLANDVPQSVAAGYVAAYSREQVLQADELGAQWLSHTQYNPENMVEMIRVLKAQDRFVQDRARAAGEEIKEGSSWLASHLSSDQRLAQIRQRAQRYKQEGSVYQNDERERYLKAFAGMPFGESSDQGLTRGQQFYHADLDIALTAPLGWKINNRPNSNKVIQNRGEAALIVKLVPQAWVAIIKRFCKAAFRPPRAKHKIET